MMEEMREAFLMTCLTEMTNNEKKTACTEWLSFLLVFYFHFFLPQPRKLRQGFPDPLY